MYLVVWTLFTIIFFIASLKHHTAMAILFGTLVIGFIGLDLKELFGMAAAGTFAAWDLIVCILTAWYLMAKIILDEVGINLPVGGLWFSDSK